MNDRRVLVCCCFFLACGSSKKSTVATQPIAVFAPLSGPEAARGDAVVAMATTVNELLAAAGSSITIDLHDSQLADDIFRGELQKLAHDSVIIVGDCRDAQFVHELFGHEAPLTITLFCESLEAISAIEADDQIDPRFFWIGPTTVSLFRVTEGYFHHKDDVYEDYGPGIDSGTIFYSSEAVADQSHLFSVIADTKTRGLDVNLVDIPISDSSQIHDYSQVIAALPAPNLFPATDRGGSTVAIPFLNYATLYLPWLTCLEWLRQAQITLSAAQWTQLRQLLFIPADYLAQDAVRQAYPFSVDGAGIIGEQGAANPAAFTQLTTDADRQFGSGALTTLSVLVADTLLSVSLTLETKPDPTPSAVRDRWLHTTGAIADPGATQVTYANFSDGLALAAKGQALDYDGVYSNMNTFNTFGQLSGDIRGVMKTFAFSDSGIGPIKSPVSIPVDPLEGYPVDLVNGVKKGCITFEQPPGTVAWDPTQSVIGLFDRDAHTGLVSVPASGGFAGMSIHFSQPLALTSVQWQHSIVPFDKNVGTFDHQVSWWATALPVGFSPMAPPIPPDGTANLDGVPFGPFTGLDWSFHAETVQTLSIIASPSITERRTIFNDFYLFATQESLANFCPD
jgi:hypothetical protein